MQSETKFRPEISAFDAVWRSIERSAVTGNPPIFSLEILTTLTVQNRFAHSLFDGNLDVWTSSKLISKNQNVSGHGTSYFQSRFLAKGPTIQANRIEPSLYGMIGVYAMATLVLCITRCCESAHFY